MNLPAGKAGSQIPKQRQIPGRDGVDATVAGQLFDGQVQRFTGKFREPHQPLNKSGELFPAAEKIGGVIAVREQLRDSPSRPGDEKPQEGGFTLGGRGVPEESIAGRADRPSWRVRSRRGAWSASQEETKEPSNPGAIRSSSSKLSSRPGNHCAASSARGPAPRVGRNCANDLCGLSGERLAGGQQRAGERRGLPAELGEHGLPPVPPGRPQAYASSSKETEEKSAAKRATMSPPSGATIRRSPTKKPSKGSPDALRRPDSRKRPRSDAPRRPAATPRRARPASPAAAPRAASGRRRQAVRGRSPRRARRRRTVNPSPARPETSPRRTTSAGAPAGEMISASPSRRHWASTLRPARTRRQVRAIAC